MAIPIRASYSADRASALAGVPRRTVYYWATTGLIVPSVSRDKVKRWSFVDLLTLRLIDWLRQDRPVEGFRVPGAPIAQIRSELAKVQNLGERLTDEHVEVLVDNQGHLRFAHADRMWVDLGEGVSQELFGSRVNLVSATPEREGQRGPDLRRPRPALRIVPGKLSGEPHVAQTRIPTEMISTLDKRGFRRSEIVELYPSLTEDQVAQAVDLERQLAENLHHDKAA